MNKKIEERLNLTEQQIRNFCQQNHIQELSLFGSVLRDDFNNNSDLDFLVVFKPEFQISLIELVDLQYQLEDLTGRKVDLIDKRSILDSYNWLRRQHILNTARVIYELRSVLSA